MQDSRHPGATESEYKRRCLTLFDGRSAGVATMNGANRRAKAKRSGQCVGGLVSTTAQQRNSPDASPWNSEQSSSVKIWHR